MDDLKEGEARAVEAAREVRDRAHAKHSGFRVGAAVEDARGELHVGCNVESASFGLTLCAERAALASWIAAGGISHAGEAVRVVIATHGTRPTPPCGACRQWLHELAPKADIIAISDSGAAAVQVARWKAASLLPDAFDDADLSGS